MAMDKEVDHTMNDNQFTNQELMEMQLSVEHQAKLWATIANQAPVKCTSCAKGSHAPWWGKSVAPLAHPGALA